MTMVSAWLNGAAERSRRRLVIVATSLGVMQDAKKAMTDMSVKRWPFAKRPHV
jgi:hypothetical protein